MTSFRVRRLPLLLAGSALTATALVVSGAGPASAVFPVDGSVQSTGSATVGAGCVQDGPTVVASKTFTNRTGGRTAQVTQSYSATSGETVGASGYLDLETTGSGAAADRAFKRVDLESTGIVSVTNDAALACGLHLSAASEAEASLKVRKRGKVKITWSSSSAGDLEQVQVTGPAGVVLDRDPTGTEGSYTFRVRRGTYHLTSSFAVAVDESTVPVGESRMTVGFYSLRAVPVH